MLHRVARAGGRASVRTTRHPRSAPCARSFQPTSWALAGRPARGTSAPRPRPSRRHPRRGLRCSRRRGTLLPRAGVVTAVMRRRALAESSTAVTATGQTASRTTWCRRVDRRCRTDLAMLALVSRTSRMPLAVVVTTPVCQLMQRRRALPRSRRPVPLRRRSPTTLLCLLPRHRLPLAAIQWTTGPLELLYRQHRQVMLQQRRLRMGLTRLLQLRLLWQK